MLISCAIIPLQVSVAECSFKTYVHPKLNRWKIVLRSEIARLIDLESVLADPESVLPAPTLYGLYTDACSRGGRLPLSLESDPNLLKFLRNKLRDRIDELDDSETVLLDPVSAELAEEIMKFRRRELEVCGKPTSRQEHFLENGGQYVLNFGPEPETLNEKTLWISRFYYGFHEYNSSEVTSWIWNKLTAKLFIRDVVGAKYVARLYGAFKNLKDLLRPKFWKKLPQKFVVKGVLGCFGNCVRVVDKSDPKTVASLRDLEYTKTSRLTEESLIVEEYLPSLREGRTVTDYKFFCSFGKIIWVVIGDAPVDLVKIGPLNPLEKFQSLYTVPSWHFLDATYYDLGRVPIERPPNLPEMMEIAQKLSS
ncbi:MAG: hypothetical protein LBC25_02690, partial [Holosporales bacterium]|nr:hypothetical protein [Holosporales bacterium]